MKVKHLKTKVVIDMGVSEYDTLFKYIGKLDSMLNTLHETNDLWLSDVICVRVNDRVENALPSLKSIGWDSFKKSVLILSIKTLGYRLVLEQSFIVDCYL